MMRILQYLSVLLVVVTLTATVGCRSKGPWVPEADEEAFEKSKAPINLLDRDLRDKVASDKSIVTRNDYGQMSIALSIRNMTDDKLYLQWRVVFKEDTGLSTGDETAWANLFLDPYQTQTVRAESKVSYADLYTVELRKGRMP